MFIRLFIALFFAVVVAQPCFANELFRCFEEYKGPKKVALFYVYGPLESEKDANEALMKMGIDLGKIYKSGNVEGFSENDLVGLRLVGLKNFSG